MTTIPRRHIYEKLLEFEDTLLEMQALIYNEEYFNEYIDNFNNEKVSLLKENFKEVIATLPLFLENKKFQKREELEAEIKYHLDNEKDTLSLIKKDRNIKKDDKEIIFKIYEIFSNLKSIKSYDEGKKIFNYLDKFDHLIPKMLEIRRDHMK